MHIFLTNYSVSLKQATLPKTLSNWAQNKNKEKHFHVLACVTDTRKKEQWTTEIDRVVPPTAARKAGQHAQSGTSSKTLEAPKKREWRLFSLSVSLSVS